MARNIDREGPIQVAIVSGLKLQFPKALIFSVPNELASKVGGGKDGAKRQHIIRNVQAKAKKAGMLPGMSDLVMLLEGQFFSFEVKFGYNKQQPNQEAVQVVVEANGGIYAVVRSFDDVMAVIREHRAVVSIPHRGGVS